MNNSLQLHNLKLTDNIKLYISTNLIAILPNNFNETKLRLDNILLMGNDFNGGYLELSPEKAIEIVHSCYRARELNISYSIICTNCTIKFT